MNRFAAPLAALALVASGPAAFADGGFLGMFGNGNALNEGRSVAIAPVSASTPTSTDLNRETPTSTRVTVADPTEAAPGSITVDTANRYLYLSMGNGQATRYDVGVGREGFE